MNPGGVRVESENFQSQLRTKVDGQGRKITFGDKTELHIVTELLSTVVHLVEKIHLHGCSQEKTLRLY